MASLITRSKPNDSSSITCSCWISRSLSTQMCIYSISFFIISCILWFQCRLSGIFDDNTDPIHFISHFAQMNNRTIECTNISSNYYSNKIAFEAHNCTHSLTIYNYNKKPDNISILPTFCTSMISYEKMKAEANSMKKFLKNLTLEIADAKKKRDKKIKKRKSDDFWYRHKSKYKYDYMEDWYPFYSFPSSTSTYKKCKAFIKLLQFQTEVQTRNIEKIIHSKKTINPFLQSCRQHIIKDKIYSSKANENLKNTNHIENCLNLPYVYKNYEQRINYLSEKSTQGTFDALLHRIKHKNEIKRMLYDIITISMEYDVILHLFGTTLLSWYRNCDPIAYHDHDLDLAIFEHHFDPQKLVATFNDKRLKEKYNFSINLDIEPTPTLDVPFTSPSSSTTEIIHLRMQFHLSSLKVYHWLNISSIDIFIINPTKFVYFTQNAWYGANFFWYFTPYQLKLVQIPIRLGMDMDIVYYNVYVPCDIPLLLSEVFGDDWKYLPWQMFENNIDTNVDHLKGDCRKVIGMRPPVKILNGTTHELTINTEKIWRFCTQYQEYFPYYSYSTYDWSLFH